MDDRDSMRGVYKSAVLAWAGAAVVCLAIGRPWIALSLTFGAAIALGLLGGLDLVVRRAFVPGARKPMRALWKLGLVKYPLLGAALIALAGWERIDLLALCGGVVLVQVGIVAGTVIAGRLGARRGARAGLAREEGAES